MPQNSAIEFVISFRVKKKIEFYFRITQKLVPAI